MSSSSTWKYRIRKISGCPRKYNRKLNGSSQACGLAEFKRAVQGLVKKKAAVPDGCAAETCQNLPCIMRQIAQLFDLIMGPGRIPLPKLTMLVVPFDKPLRAPVECGSKGPISLSSTLPKGFEVAVLHRLMCRTETGLDGRQYAFRRGRGAEAHLIEAHEFSREALGADKYGSVASVDVDSAFGAVPHTQLIQTVENLGADPFICGFKRKRRLQENLSWFRESRHFGCKRRRADIPAVWGPLAEGSLEEEYYLHISGYCALMCAFAEQKLPGGPRPDHELRPLLCG